MPAREPKSQLVVNVRNQPVEIHHGSDAVVIPPLGQVMLPVVPSPQGDHLAELLRRGLVRVEQPAAPEPEAATAGGPRRPRKPSTRKPKKERG